VLREYRSKSKEFEKATKKSRQSYQAFERDIKQLNKRITGLEAEKKKAEKSGAIGKAAASAADMTKKLEADWAAEKASLDKDRDALKTECAALQE
jgi:hypothetical protein